MPGGNSNTSIIGGMFGLQATPDEDAQYPPFLADTSFFLINSRSSIWYLINSLKPRQVWCPSYLCHTIIDAINRTESRINFFEVDDQLSIPKNNWVKKVEKGDIVIFINYFGFPTEERILSDVKEAGAWIVSDSSQTLFLSNGEDNIDFSIYSPRKIIGIVDGGIICQHSKLEMDMIKLEQPEDSWWLRAFQASILRRDFDIQGNDRKWFEIFQETEKESPIGAYKMSDLSKGLLLNHFNYNRIFDKRRENYSTLATRLESIALKPYLPENVAPLGFPIIVSNRDSVRESLFKNQIYPPVHWDIKNWTPERFRKSHALSREIMTIPCDQRYDTDTMEMIADHLLRVIQ
jgi:dTDP-4-amino-4,6-dideoxygalactose transaminase